MLSRRTLLAAALVLGATPALAQSPAPAAKLPVVASFSILGDFVKNVGGDRIALSTIVGPNADTHVYQPSRTTRRSWPAPR